MAIDAYLKGLFITYMMCIASMYSINNHIPIIGVVSHRHIVHYNLSDDLKYIKHWNY